MQLVVESINQSHPFSLASRSLLVLPTFTGLSFLLSPRTLYLYRQQCPCQFSILLRRVKTRLVDIQFNVPLLCTTHCNNERNISIFCVVICMLEHSSFLPFFKTCREKILVLRPNAGHGLHILEVSRSHTATHHSRQDSSGRVISSSQRHLPDNTQHSQQTNIHAPGGIRTPTLSTRAAANLRLRPRGHWEPAYIYIYIYIYIYTCI